MAIKKNRLTPQDIEDVIACGYTLAQIARESGVDRISLSKFRNHGQALKAADQAALISWLQENNLWADDAAPGPAKAGKAAPTAMAATQVFPRPLVAIAIDADLDDDTTARLSERADVVAAEIKRLAASKLTYDDFLLIKDEEPNDDSKADHQQLIGLLAEFSILQFRMHGNDIAPPTEMDGGPTTHAELLAREFPWPAGGDDPDPDAEPADESLAAGTDGNAQGRGFADFIGSRA